MKPINNTRLNQASELLRQYVGTERHKKDVAERRERQKAFAKLLNEPFSEFAFSQVIRQLWAAQMWGNRDYLVSQILTKTGLEVVKREWTALLSGDGTPGQRYEKFVSTVLHMGPSMVTEILCYHEPAHAGIWNAVARQSLGWLFDDDPLFRKYKLSGKEYDTFNELARTLGQQLGMPATDGDLDLLNTDYALWEIRELALPAKAAAPVAPATTPSAPSSPSRHNELRDKVVEIGSGLGFDAQPEVEVAAGSKVDVVWRARIANLGSVAYVFEVQDRGSIDSLIVNLQQARATLGAKKLCVVSDRDQLDKIQKRVQTMPEELRKNLLFWEAIEVDAVFENLESVTQVLQRIGLLE